MKIFLTVLFAMFAVYCRAFSSASWLASRADETDMIRLRSAWTNFSARAMMPAENVSFPLENWPDGTVKTRLSAKKANFFFSEGIIWAEGVVVEQFTQSGDGNGALFAENCIVDRVSKSGWINGKAELCQGGSVVKGEGVYFSAEKNQVVITSRSEIRLTGIKLDKKSLKKEVSK